VPQLAAVRPGAFELEFSPPLPVNPQRPRVSGFTLCGDDVASCVPAEAQQRGSRIEVSRAVRPDATRIRFCWSDGGTCALRSLAGVPVGSFELPVESAGR